MPEPAEGSRCALRRVRSACAPPSLPAAKACSTLRAHAHAWARAALGLSYSGVQHGPCSFHAEHGACPAGSTAGALTPAHWGGCEAGHLQRMTSQHTKTAHLYTVARVRPATEVGSAKGRSTAASIHFLPGNLYLWQYACACARIVKQHTKGMSTAAPIHLLAGERALQQWAHAYTRVCYVRSAQEGYSPRKPGRSQGQQQYDVRCIAIARCTPICAPADTDMMPCQVCGS